LYEQKKAAQAQYAREQSLSTNFLEETQRQGRIKDNSTGIESPTGPFHSSTVTPFPHNRNMRPGNRRNEFMMEGHGPGLVSTNEDRAGMDTTSSCVGLQREMKVDSRPEKQGDFMDSTAIINALKVCTV